MVDDEAPAEPSVAAASPEEAPDSVDDWEGADVEADVEATAEGGDDAAVAVDGVRGVDVPVAVAVVVPSAVLVAASVAVPAGAGAPAPCEDSVPVDSCVVSVSVGDGVGVVASVTDTG